MSVQAPPPQPPRAPDPATLRCPRCGATVFPEQDWCLDCGAPARTRLAPTPSWRLPILLVATVVVLAGLALAIAFTALTRDDGTVTTTTGPTTAPSQPTEANQGAVAGSALPGGAGVIQQSSTVTPAPPATPSSSVPSGTTPGAIATP